MVSTGRRVMRGGARAEFQEGVYRDMVHSIANKRAETELALFTCVQKARSPTRPAPQRGSSARMAGSGGAVRAATDGVERQRPAFPGGR